ncbi:MAG TPA: hypothetical protein VNB24_01795 [Acidimicrobiales bacterium]|nr:hypothetical protein [Acidimicrobiales bacterium]
MRRRALLLLALAATAAPVAVGFGASPAQAGCPDYNNPCDPPPHPIEEPVWLEWGCGTVTVHAFNKYEKTVDFRLCPGPMP